MPRRRNRQPHPVARVARPEKNNDLHGPRERSPEPGPRRRPTGGSRDDRRATRKSGFLDTPLKCLKHTPKYIVSNSDTYSSDQIAIARKSAELPSANCRSQSHGATNHRTSLANDIRLEGLKGSYEHYIKRRKPNERLLGKGWHDDEEGPSAVCCPISSVCSSHGRHRSLREHPD